MTPPCGTDRHAEARAALEQLWHLSRRLAQAQDEVRGTLPITRQASPTVEEEDAITVGSPLLSGLDQVLVEAFLFCLGATVTALVEEVMEPLLLLEGQMLFLDVAENFRTLEEVGAIPSAEQVLALCERVRRHHLITMRPAAAQAEALNNAWIDGQVLLDVLVHLFRHIRNRGLSPGLPDFEENQT